MTNSRIKPGDYVIGTGAWAGYMGRVISADDIYTGYFYVNIICAHFTTRRDSVAVIAEFFLIRITEEEARNFILEYELSKC